MRVRGSCPAPVECGFVVGAMENLLSSLEKELRTMSRQIMEQRQSAEAAWERGKRYFLSDN
jgi:hypothetical protein